MWYDYPVKEEFDVTFSIKVGGNKGVKKKLRLKYFQASIYETIQFMKHLENDTTGERLKDFLKKYWNIDKVTLWLISIDKQFMDKVFNTIKDTRFRWVFASKKQKEDDNIRPYSSVLVFLAKEINIDPHTFQMEYTVEQMNYLMWGVVYNINDQTEEGKQINQKNEFNKKHNDSDLLKLIS